MGVAKKYNKTNTASFTFKPGPDFPYEKLKDVFDPKNPNRVFLCRGVFLNPKSKYSKAVMINDDCYVNLPAHLEGTVDDILQDQEAIDQINAGLLGYRIREYAGQNGKNYSIDWVDLDAKTLKENHITSEQLPF